MVVTARFDDIYASGGRYDVEVPYFDEKDGQCELRLYVNGNQQGAARLALADDDAWRSKIISDVTINTSGEIMVEVRGDFGEYGKLNYVQFNYRGSV